VINALSTIYAAFFTCRDLFLGNKANMTEMGLIKVRKYLASLPMSGYNGL
jgi:predicted acetyltransferase